MLEVSASVIIRQSDLTPITYTLSNSDKTLELRFDYSGPGFHNGRVESVAGEWIFAFDQTIRDYTLEKEPARALFFALILR